MSYIWIDPNRQPKPDEVALIKATGEAMFHFIRDMRGDPRLEACEEAFLTKLDHCLYNTGFGAIFSKKQLDQLWRIADRLEQAPADEEGTADRPGEWWHSMRQMARADRRRPGRQPVDVQDAQDEDEDEIADAA